jgi:PAS domain S-box-containing protein
MLRHVFSQITSHRRRWQITAIFLVFCSYVAAGKIGAQVNPIRRVLVFYEVGPHYPAIALIDKGISDILRNSPYQIELHREYLDTALFPDPATQREFREWYTGKYRDRRPDIIIAVGPSPLGFMIAAHEAFFRDVPVVFCLSSAKATGRAKLGSHFTGMWEEPEPTKTLEAALRLKPGTKHVFLVGGTSPYDRSIEALYREGLHNYESKLDVKYLTDLAMPELLDRLRHLPDHSVVLHLGILRDAAGKQFIDATEAGPMVVQAANAPVFTLSDLNLGHGEVGGNVFNLADEGKVAASTALRILRGEKPQDIPIVRNVNIYMFDWRALKRWGMKESNLPPGSIVLNRQPTAWELYQWYIIGGIVLMLLEALLIFGLLWQRARRRQTNRVLEKRTTELQAREELLKIFVKNVPAGVAMLDRDMRYLQVSDRWCADYGVDASQILGRSHYEALPDMPDRWREIHRRALDGETLRADEDRWDRKSGTTWVRWEVRPWLNVDGELGGILIFAEEITRRKQADEALSGMSRRLIESQEQERSRIGRELHDDINQRLALLAVELDRLGQSGSTKDLHNILQESKGRVMEIATDVQALSHQLHSSKLEYLGLAAAAKSFCREISEMHNVRIDFTQTGVPRNLPEEVALCVFRVLQEALQNAVKYSGTDHFEVDLFGTSADIRLRVRDFGRGFSVDDAMKTKGLGLVSMRERVNLVKGEIVIKSKPMAGTEITVHVPVPIADRASEVTSEAA